MIDLLIKKITQILKSAGLNKILIFACIILGLYTVYDLFVVMLPRQARITFSENASFGMLRKNRASAPADEKPAKQEQVKPLSYYIQDTENKDIFRLSAAQDVNLLNQASLPLNAKFDEIAKSFVLKGIIAGAPPQAVIEDTRANKSYFASKGESVAEAVVEEITDNKVKLKIGVQTIDLTL